MCVCRRLAGVKWTRIRLQFQYANDYLEDGCSQYASVCPQDRCSHMSKLTAAANTLSKIPKAHMNNISSAYSYVSLLKASAKLKDLEGGLKLHSHIAELGYLETSPFLGSTLVDTFAKCGSLTKAEQVFQKLAVQDVVSWTALIAGYVDQGHYREAFNCFERMQGEGVSPNVVTFSCTLKACGRLEEGQSIHAELERQGLLGKDPILGNSLLDLYARWGLLATAQEVFDRLPTQNVISWTSLISGYVEQGHYDEAVKCYERMQLKGVFPNAFTYVSCLKAFSCMGAIDKGRSIHAEIERWGLTAKDPFVGSTLVDMYAKCGLLDVAKEVFETLQARCIISWNALIAGCTEHGDSADSLKCFEQIQVEGLFPDVVTFACYLKACGNLCAIYKGKELHAKLQASGLLESGLIVGNAVIDLYVKCGLLPLAHQVFDKLVVRDAISWTTLMAGYAEHGFSREALECSEQMRLEGVFPDAVTLAYSLKACSNIGAAYKGEQMYIELDRQGMLNGDFFVGNSLLEMYVDCGLLLSGQHTFNKLPVQDDFSWSTMIAGYVRHGHNKEALKWFEQAQAAGISPNAAIFVWSMKACGSMGALDKAEELHSEIESLGLFGRDTIVSNALVSMYVECGCLARAEQVFDRLVVQDVVSWTALLSGYSQFGVVKSVFLSFKRMVSKGIKPDSVAFVILLSACARAGLSGESEAYFDIMTRNYGVITNVKHHGTMASLFGRTGQLNKAIAIVRNPLCHGNVVVWSTVLGACEHWGCVDLGKEAFAFECSTEKMS